MKCRDCPYIKEDFDRKTQGMTDKYDLNEFERSCWCEKTGAKIWRYGQCEDDYDNVPSQTNRSKQRKRNKRERDLKHKQRLKFLAENAKGYPSPAIYTNEIWLRGYGWVENQKPYYKRLYRGSNHRGINRYKYYKKYANRQVRRYNGELHNGCQYKKVYDYWRSVD